MKQIRDYANTHAWPVSLMIVAVYIAVFAIPSLRGPNALGHGTTANVASGYAGGAFVMMLPAMLYGLFLLWRWSKWQKENPNVTA